MKEGGGAEGECERERALGVLLCHSLVVLVFTAQHAHYVFPECVKTQPLKHLQ